jgi:hypothetical protein
VLPISDFVQFHKITQFDVTKKTPKLAALGIEDMTGKKNTLSQVGFFLIQPKDRT